ncbi:MAG: glycosyltransferase family 2 protein [bacterium]|nr:glycosyltransferase family 2 protein [bacterium]
MNRETAIVVLYYNKLRLTVRCIQSVLDAGYPPDQVYCFDNGSKPDVFHQLYQAFPTCRHLRNDTNLGFSGGFNRSLEQVFTIGFTSALFCTNDTIIEPGAAEACLETASQTEAGMVAPQVNYLFRPDAIDSIGAYFDNETGLLHHYHDHHLPMLLDSTKDYIPGTALWINKETFQILDGTDESYHMYWEDVDLSFRAHHEGIPLARSYDARFSHGVGQTNRKKPLYTTFYFLRNRIRFCRLYLYGDAQEKVLRSIHNELIQLGNRWKQRNDTRRIGYFHKLIEELAIDDLNSAILSHVPRS